VTQAAHGFAVGDVLYLNGTTYTKAKADAEGTAEVVGIVSAISPPDDFTLLVVGKVTGLSSLTAGAVYYLSDTTAGALTATEPADTGEVSKPLLIADTTTSGYLFNMRGLLLSDPGSGAATSIAVAQTSHGFAVGDAVYLTAASTYAKAKADAESTAEVAGIVSAVAGPNDFTLALGGRVTGLSGLTAAIVYYLSAATAGALTATEPTGIGAISKPVLIADTTTSGFFFNMRGIKVSDLSSLAVLATGWTSAGETFTYASSTTFTVAGDQTAKYSIGTRIKLTQTTLKYFVVVASSYSSSTTVTVTGGTDYTLANATISDPYYSYSVNPQGYPGWFAYTPTWTATGSNPAIGDGTIVGRFNVAGKVANLSVVITMGSTTTYGTGDWRLSIPVVVQRHNYGSVQGVDTGTAFRTGMVWFDADNQVARLLGTYDQSATEFTSAIPHTWANTDILRFSAAYEI
jgi:hypothetical protein